MISVDTSALADDLAKFKLEAERKLKAMVVGFANDVAYAASEATPVGDLEKYARLYKMRFEDPRLQIAEEVGFHSGTWRYDADGALQFDNQIYSKATMLQDVKSDVNSNYKLGKTFYIAAKGPAFSMLENGQSPRTPNGIMQPAEAAILAAYKSNIYYYYKKG